MIIYHSLYLIWVNKIWKIYKFEVISYKNVGNVLKHKWKFSVLSTILFMYNFVFKKLKIKDSVIKRTRKFVKIEECCWLKCFTNKI